MIIIDFGIICIGQSEITYPNNIESVEFEVENRRSKSKSMYEYDEWCHFETADSLVGKWYLAWLSKDIFFEQSFFDLSDKGFSNVCVVPKWKDTVKRILDFYIQESPVHQIAVLLRMQDESNNISHPVCSVKEFMDHLTDGEVKWNELYFIIS